MKDTADNLSVALRIYAASPNGKQRFYRRPRVIIGAICDEFECCGYRCAGAAPRHQGIAGNGKKLRRLRACP